jgi:hypothetical protein
MRKTLCSFVFLFSLVLMLFASSSFADSLPDDDLRDYAGVKKQYFTNNTFSLSGTSVANYFKTALLFKQESIIREVTDLLKDVASKDSSSQTAASFSNSLLTGDLQTLIPDSSGSLKPGYSLWDKDDLSYLKSNESGTYFKIKYGSYDSTIYIPRGVKVEVVPDGVDANGNPKTKIIRTPVNGNYINFAITAINAYKTAVKEAILAVAVKESYNIYSIYPDKQVPVTDILEPVDSSNPNGRQKIKTSFKDVTMSYSLDYHYNLLIGKIPGDELLASGFTWTKYLDRVKVSSAGNDKIAVEVSEDFLRFIASGSDERETMMEIDTTVVKSAGFTANIKPTYLTQTFEPRSMIDSSMRLIVPHKFTKLRDSGNAVLLPIQGYQTIPNFKLSLSNFYVYGLNSEGKYEKLGDFNQFGISKKSLVLFYTSLLDQKDLEKEYDLSKPLTTEQLSEIAKVGAVIPLEYREAIIDTRNRDLYLTGREIGFSNDYSGKIKINVPNKDLFRVSEKLSGIMAVPLRYFAFWEDAKYQDARSHVELPIDVSNFTLQMDFMNKTFTTKNSTTGVEESTTIKGFIMLRNNFYLYDPDLISWLNSSEAKAMTGVQAETLYDMLTGNFPMDNKPLTYDEWTRLQEIKNELESTKASSLMKMIRVSSIIFGVFILIYVMILMLAYLIDIAGFGNEFSILYLITFKRLYPIWSKNDLEYVSPAAGVKNDKYVTFIYMVIVMIAGVAIGLLFIMNNLIIKFLVWIYQTIQSVTGLI